LNRFIFSGLVAIALLTGCGSGPETVRAAVKPVSTRKVAAPFTLKDADGKPLNLADFKGKVVLLNFWATWCGPCKIEIPWFIEFEKTYRDKGFAVIGVSMDDDGWAAVKPHMAKTGINYRMTIGDEQTAVKYGGVDSLPTTFLIDREGRVAAVHVGLVSKGDYVKDIEQLLAAAK
jgi:thiol-disulfide isomerase/thioredoxin